MEETKPKTVDLYSVREGKIVPWELSVDQNHDIVATHDVETLKFPAGLSKEDFLKLVDEHNKVHDGIVARTDDDVKAEEALHQNSIDLIDSL